ncbi:MAG: DUF4124 domain-containing protein [Alcanivorax sediminis]|uniref:DUF4124 domain-containing protein n=1 Tax=Alcanivorax sediminis TaxID=2663008 RepID=UPI003C590D33
MKRQWGLLLGLAVLSSTVIAEEAADKPASGIYRSVDANGNVVFTDQPPESGESEEVKLRELNTVPIKQVDLSGIGEAEESEDNVFKGYSSLEITSPANEATVRNPESAVVVTVELEPNLRSGDSLVLYHNGVAQASMSIQAPERGVHSLVVKVLDRDGQVLISSSAVEFYVHRSSASDFRRRPDANGATANVGSGANRGGAASVGGAANGGGTATVGGAADRATPARPALPRPTPRN